MSFNFPLLLCALPMYLRQFSLKMNSYRIQVLEPLLIALGSCLAVAAVLYISYLVYREFRHTTKRA